MNATIEVCPGCGSEHRSRRRAVVLGPGFGSPSNCPNAWHDGQGEGYQRDRAKVVADRKYDR